ncbi:uncharacterized protein LOC141529107 [Cotesia typhae]|uniref:uncharacterized protein LOC141529107 n=1 Tax=Cotesia typhae TaxID=2053667 RepID=UPI003D69FA32
MTIAVNTILQTSKADAECLKPFLTAYEVYCRDELLNSDNTSDDDEDDIDISVKKNCQKTSTSAALKGEIIRLDRFTGVKRSRSRASSTSSDDTYVSYPTDTDENMMTLSADLDSEEEYYQHVAYNNRHNSDAEEIIVEEDEEEEEEEEKEEESTPLFFDDPDDYYDDNSDDSSDDNIRSFVQSHALGILQDITNIHTPFAA